MGDCASGRIQPLISRNFLYHIGSLFPAAFESAGEPQRKVTPRRRWVNGTVSVEVFLPAIESGFKVALAQGGRSVFDSHLGSPKSRNHDIFTVRVALFFVGHAIDALGLLCG